MMVRKNEKSYAAATATAIVDVNDPIASSKFAPSSGCSAKYSLMVV
jgi:hypothetical protein